MSIKIGHASGDENGKATGGKAGDQTGKEVCVRSWYSNAWDFVLRPKDPNVAEKSAVACEKACNNAHIGYDQNQRNTLHTKAKLVGYDLSKVTADCETDCSALMTVCAIAGGVSSLEYTGNAPTTRTMRKVFVASGAYEILTDKKYLTTDANLKRGDILVKEGRHTAMVLTNGSAFSASTNGSEKFDSAYKNGKLFTVSAFGLNLRSGYGKTHKSIGILSKGTKLMYYGYHAIVNDTEWKKVQVISGPYNGKVGFVSSEFIK